MPYSIQGKLLALYSLLLLASAFINFHSFSNQYKSKSSIQYQNQLTMKKKNDSKNNDAYNELSTILEQHEHIMLILIGIPGSGKSTFARSLTSEVVVEQAKESFVPPKSSSTSSSTVAVAVSKSSVPVSSKKVAASIFKNQFQCLGSDDDSDSDIDSGERTEIDTKTSSNQITGNLKPDKDSNLKVSNSIPPVTSNTTNMSLSSMWRSVNQDAFKTRQKTFAAAEEIMINQLREQFTINQMIKSGGSNVRRNQYEYDDVSSVRYKLIHGKHIIIDRCNFDESQRLTWIKLAHKYQYACISIVLPNYDNVDVCVARAYTRGNDGIHSGSENWAGICARMANDMILPTYEEGFHWIHLSSSDSDLSELTQFITANSFPRSS